MYFETEAAKSKWKRRSYHQKSLNDLQSVQVNLHHEQHLFCYNMVSILPFYLHCFPISHMITITIRLTWTSPWRNLSQKGTEHIPSLSSTGLLHLHHLNHVTCFCTNCYFAAVVVLAKRSINKVCSAVPPGSHLCRRVWISAGILLFISMDARTPLLGNITMVHRIFPSLALQWATNKGRSAKFRWTSHHSIWIFNKRRTPNYNTGESRRARPIPWRDNVMFRGMRSLRIDYNLHWFPNLKLANATAVVVIALYNET